MKLCTKAVSDGENKLQVGDPVPAGVGEALPVSIGMSN